MNYRMEELDSLRIVGRKFEVNTKSAFDIVPGIWHREMESGFLPKLIDMSWERPKCKLESLLGVIGLKPRIHDETFDYFIGIWYDDEAPEGMEVLTLPSLTWVVFPDVINAWKRIYTEWLPGSGYDLADAPIVECHYAPGHDPASELWVPVITVHKEQQPIDFGPCTKVNAGTEHMSILHRILRSADLDYGPHRHFSKQSKQKEYKMLIQLPNTIIDI